MNTEIVAGPTAGGVRVERLITSGVFALDGGEWEVDNNVWIVGNDNHCIVIDAAHDPDAILAAIGDRELTHIVCTHAHNDHIDGAPGVAQATGAPIHLHPADRVLWELTFPDTAPDADPCPVLPNQTRQACHRRCRPRAQVRQRQRHR